MVMRKSTFVTLAALLAHVALGSVASAEDKTAKPASAGVTTADTLHVTGRVPRPQVITEVARVTPAQHLAQLRQPLLERVEQALDKSPF
jgi:hypothetical protein